MSLADILNSFRPGELIDDGQIEELKRWQLLDFVSEPEETYVSDAPVVVVCGCGRSGTTLVRVMLDSHPDLYGGPESLLFLPIPIDCVALASKFELDQAQLELLREESGRRARFIDEFQRLLLSRNGKSRWVDKTARNVHRLEYILARFPNAKIIHVVRDPRDVVASLKLHKRRKIEDGRIVGTGYCMPVDLCIARWQLAIDDASEHRGSESYYEVKYEDLVRNTESTLRSICGFLNVDFHEQMLSFHRFDGPTRDYMKFPQNIEATQPISDAPIGRYRTTLTADEIETVERRLGAYMELFGYRAPQSPKSTAANIPRQSNYSRHVSSISSDAIQDVIGDDPLRVKQWTREAFRAHHEKRFIQPQKTYLFTTDDPYDRIISLPAAVLGEESAKGIKWIGSHSRNHERGLDRAHAIIVLNDLETHAPTVVMDGTLISSMRTMAVSLIAMDQFAPRPTSVGIIGMGKLGRMHARFLGDLYPSIEIINCFSRSAPFDDLLPSTRIRKCESAKELVSESEVIITLSAARAPYIDEPDLSTTCRLIVNLSLMDCHLAVMLNSDHVVVDDWLQNSKAEKVFKQGVDQGLLTRERVLELGTVLFGPRKNYVGRVFVNPIGMGLEDVYVAGKVARLLGVYP